MWYGALAKSSSVSVTRSLQEPVAVTGSPLPTPATKAADPPEAKEGAAPAPKARVSSAYSRTPQAPNEATSGTLRLAGQRATETYFQTPSLPTLHIT